MNNLAGNKIGAVGAAASVRTGTHLSHLNTMTSTATSISINFEELQKELQSFNELFGMWTEQRRRALMEDKEAYLRTLSEEQGSPIIMFKRDIVIFLLKRYGRGTEEALSTAPRAEAANARRA